MTFFTKCLFFAWCFQLQVNYKNIKDEVSKQNAFLLENIDNSWLDFYLIRKFSTQLLKVQNNIVYIRWK